MNLPEQIDVSRLVDEFETLSNAYEALAMLARGANESGFTYAADPGHVADVMVVLNRQQKTLVGKLAEAEQQATFLPVGAGTRFNRCHSGH